MSRAQSLAAAADYLHDAVTGLEGASKVLDSADLAADRARDLCLGTRGLHQEVKVAARAAHRAERPEFYDESGRWVGRGGKEQG